MSIDPDQPYFAPSGDWFGDFSNYSAGLGDTVSIGITKRIRTWVGYDDVVNYDSGAYAGGQYTGTAVNVGLGVVNPCALGSAVAIPVRLINVGQAIGGTINAGENIANGNYVSAGFDLIGVAGNSSQVFRPCFAAGTPVRTATGSILIENLKVGDIVLSRNEFDPEGQVGDKIVEDVFVRSAPILKVVVQGRVIRTTAEHPFWVDGKGWTAAGELKAGDHLLTVDKSKLTVENVIETGDAETVYNFRVADWHTYFVGDKSWEFEVWVHNACGPGGQTPSRNLPRFDGPKPAYSINPAHVPGKGLRPGKTPLPPDAEEVFRRAVPADSIAPRSWYGRNSKGQIYRYSDSNDGTAHFSGIDDVGDGIRNITKYALQRLEELSQ